jgi:hypothetical protein
MNNAVRRSAVLAAAVLAIITSFSRPAPVLAQSAL